MHSPTSDERLSVVDAFRLRHPEISKLPWTSATLWGVLFVAFVSVHLMIVTGLNTSSALTVINDRGVATAFLGSAVSLVPALLALVPIVAYFTYVEARYEGRSVTRHLWVFGLGVFLVLSFTPWSIALVPLGMVFVGMLGEARIAITVRQRAKRKLLPETIEWIRECAADLSLCEQELASTLALQESCWTHASYLRRMRYDGEAEQVTELGLALRPRIVALRGDVAEHRAHLAAYEIQREIETHEAGLRFWRRAHHPNLKEGRGLASELIVSILALAGLWALYTSLTGPLWLPEEIVTQTNGKAISGYVVASDQDWTTVLDGNTDEVVRLQTAFVKSRVECHPRNAFDNRPIMWFASTLQRPVPRTRCLDNGGGLGGGA